MGSVIGIELIPMCTASDLMYLDLHWSLHIIFFSEVTRCSTLLNFVTCGMLFLKSCDKHKHCMYMISIDPGSVYHNSSKKALHW